MHGTGVKINLYISVCWFALIFVSDYI